MTFENTNVKLADLSVDVSYGYTASANAQKVGPKFLRITDIQGGVVDWDEVPYCEIDARKFAKNKLSEGDIVVARTGNSTGENYLYAYSDEAVFASYLIRFRISPELANPYFVWLQMRGQRWWNYVAGSKSGSAQAGANAKVLGQFEFFLPERKIQDDVAQIFFGINEKIKLNTQTNQTLEQIAQAIFKSWFVDFEPVKAKMAVLNSLSPRERVGVRAKEQAELAAMSAISAAGHGSPNAASAGRAGAAKDETALKQLQAEQPDAYTELAQTAALFPAAMVDSELGEIPEGWEVTKTEQLAEKIAMGPFGSNIKVSTFVDSGIPIISGHHLKEVLATEGNHNFITEEHSRKLKNSCVTRGDIIFTHAGNIGQVSLIPENTTYEKYVISQRQFYLRTNRKKASPYFLVFFFRSTYGQHILLSNASQVGVPSIARPSSHLKSIELIKPSFELMEKFELVCRSLLNGIVSNRIESQELGNLRDTLLPKLLSGELTIPNTEEA